MNDRIILLVEDNPDDETLTLRALKKNNILNRVVVAHDGQEALEWIFGRGVFAGRDPAIAPSIVLLDLKLPKVDGIDVLRAVKADPDLKVIPVVVLTSSREDRDIVESYRLGVNSYIVKPVDFEQFVGAVRDLGFYWLRLNEQPPPE